ncbi:protocatechuate 3,4-dioxygenase subunit alpha [Azospirillum sp. RWY-5-1]|uniref:Protocatechuate 3,4-dioxygenase subunit alpha n=1 Tax=Azospirillum oleiclasticum TaxID=2735135 RepID=A0ABX2TA00_9PROT|nr:protocatechuate 3,4-dioxygenase subunit alpha [Azospirillum oleiclasticum]NYZ12659.1 protocatechuate 3,4-dioxygenase subunit alpha [Azospirillum oleiclasticum]NYZ19819.1 protocatechuate 3,4-dioxygenase subunit alpha [Azospirillum oleiclasticum]
MALKQTPSQTVGPYFAYGLTPTQYGYDLPSIAGPELATEETDGQPIRIVGQVFDGQGQPIGDAMIEIWQADAQGRYAHPADSRNPNATFRGFGRCGTGTDPRNRFVFETVKPGPTGDGSAPHTTVIVFMRGMLTHAYTRLYFSDEAEANAADPVLASVPEDRRDTLIAKREDTAAGVVYRFDIHMQGDRETVFFEV